LTYTLKAIKNLLVFLFEVRQEFQNVLLNLLVKMECEVALSQLVQQQSVIDVPRHQILPDYLLAFFCPDLELDNTHEKL
jgi:hypothetical protein